MNYQELMELYIKTCKERDDARANYQWIINKVINEKSNTQSPSSFEESELQIKSSSIRDKNISLEHKYGVLHEKNTLLREDLNTLIRSILDCRIVRSTCSDSDNGSFRVHCSEKEWDNLVQTTKTIINSK